MKRATNKSRPRALSLFSGAGGMDIGVSDAGFEILACVEKDPNCCETLRVNIERKGSGTKVLCEDVKEFDPRQLMKSLSIRTGELDLLFGGPPCQAFSQIGKQKGLDDPRGLLLFEIARYAKAIKPKVILVEQVKGLLNAKDHKGKPGGAFELFISQLASLGYIAKWKIINAAEHGLPQSRKRIFIVATRKTNGYEFPSATHSKPQTLQTLFPLLPYSTVGMALRGLRKPPRLNGKPPFDSHVDVTPQGDQKRILGVPEGSYLAAQLHLPKQQRGKLTKKDTTKYKRLHRKQPSLTLRCGEIFFHPTQDRYLTPREYMRLHGFPDEYLFKGPIRSRSGRVRDLDQHRQVANSVPPPLAKILAEKILAIL